MSVMYVSCFAVDDLVLFACYNFEYCVVNYALHIHINLSYFL